MPQRSYRPDREEVEGEVSAAAVSLSTVDPIVSHKDQPPHSGGPIIRCLHGDLCGWYPEFNNMTYRSWWSFSHFAVRHMVTTEDTPQSCV